MKSNRRNPSPNPNCPIMTAVIDTIKRNTGGAARACGGDVSFTPPGTDAEISATQSAEPTSVDVSTDKMKFFFPSGSTPLPRYTIRRGLGVGGFGEVYFAVSEAGKEVALKRIQRNLDIELRGVSQCLNLKHPNLVALYDICRDEDDGAWVVMEYVAGKNLRQILNQHPQGLGEGEVRRWFAEMAAGVDHLHAAGLVHRDLKPGNLFDDMGVVKVGDYGLSKFISASQRGGHTESVGTFHYMAPEIGRGQYGRGIDLYAMGVILFELLTGRVPFDGESCHEIIVKHLTALPDLTGIDQPYRSVIAAALEKDPAKRPANVAAMLAPLGLTTTSPVIGWLSSMPASVAPTDADGSPVYTASVVREAEEKQSPAPESPPPGVGFDPVGAAATAQASPNAPMPTNEEPIARAVRQSLRSFGHWWGTMERSPGAKTALFIIGIVTLVINTHWLLPTLWVLGIFYVPYYIIRNMVLHVRQQPSYAQAQRVAESQPARRRPHTMAAWRHQMRNGLKAKHTTTRIAELGTSSIVAVLTTFFLAIIAGIVGLRSGPVGPLELAPYGLLTAVGIVSSLAVLLMGKLWERGEGESLRRRIALAGVGAGIGLFVFGFSQHLMLSVDSGLTRVIDSTTLPQALYAEGGLPRGSALAAHFALLFAGLRWWKMVDPLRKRRLSLWSVAVAIVAEWLVHQILPIPQPAGMLLAGGIAIVVQMSAPWVNPALQEDPPRRPEGAPGFTANPQPIPAGTGVGVSPKGVVG